MSDRRIDLGPTGETVRKNVTRLREDQNLSFAELSRRLEAADNPIPPLGLRRIEAGERRVNVDDLTALAYVLKTSPAYLLMPHSPERDRPETLTGIGQLEAFELWKWIQDGHFPMDTDDPAKINHAAISTVQSIPLFMRLDMDRREEKFLKARATDGPDLSLDDFLKLARQVEKERRGDD